MTILAKQNRSAQRKKVSVRVCSVIFSFLFFCPLYPIIDDNKIYLGTNLIKKKDERRKTEPAQQSTAPIISSSQLWRKIQEKVSNTVIQMVVHVSAPNLLQPFATPAQGAKTGSGFFINEEGDAITNAHVIDQASEILGLVPCLGKQYLEFELIGTNPDRDLALLRLTEQSKQELRAHFKDGKIPYLELGDSDKLFRSDDVLALGYPLGQYSLKSTTGVISGYERHYIQISAPINPGNSGGPLLDTEGKVVGINSAMIFEAQNVGYAIPVNDLKLILSDLYTIPLMRKPFLGVFFNNGSAELTEYLGNPLPGGCYVIGVLPGSTLDKAGVQRGDMIYEINGYTIDIYGDIKFPWSEDKMSIVDYVGRLQLGQELSLVVYRKGKRVELSIQFNLTAQPPIRRIYPGYEPLDYQVIAGMVVMPLSLNHIQILIEGAPGLADFADIKGQARSALVVTHVFPNSLLSRTRTIFPGSTLVEVNGIAVHTLEELRAALKEGIHNKFLTIASKDNASRMSDPVFVVLNYEKVLAQEYSFAANYKYPVNETVKELLEIVSKRQAAKGSSIKRAQVLS